MQSSKHENVRLKLRGPRRIVVRVEGRGGRGALLDFGGLQMRCAIGRSGTTRAKVEGDGATPTGAHRVLGWWLQPGATPFFRGAQTCRTTRRDDGWCDDPKSGAYNRRVRLPFPYSCETMWRDDGKYRVVGVLDYNVRRRRAGAGSAIFFHLCDGDYAGTAGCIAVTAADMRKLLPRLPRNLTMIVV